jgi:hypothetical protein
MKQEIKVLIGVLLCVICFTNSNAQQATTATGGNAAGTGGSASYSVGQIVYQAVTGTTGSAYQGVQQPYEISVVTVIDNTVPVSLDCLVYPNPVSGLLRLVVSPNENDKLSYRLYNLNGVLLLDKRIENAETDIYLGNFSSSVFFLKVIRNNADFKVFKIIKK